MASVKLQKLTKRFGKVRAVDAIDLDIADREMIVLVGPSGCGKTTTLRMIAGLEDVTSGEIYIGERLVNRVKPKDRDIAMVFQSYALYPHMTVRDNMAFGLKMRRTPKDEINRRVASASEILGLAELLDRKPNALSGGQQQRVALGRAIVRDPAVFLFDEPLSNLDAKLRVRMRSELVRLHQRLETTMVYVTHDQVEAMMMGDRIVVMNEGSIQQVGPPAEVYARPANRFVAEFVGSPPMNMLAATLRKTPTQVRLESASWNMEAPLSEWRWQGGDGDALFLGIRPENLRLASEDGESSTGLALQTQVQVVQNLGAETHVECERDGIELTIRLSRGTLQPGDEVTLELPWESCHFFDASSGERLPETDDAR